ncbi:hypothetical protein GCM10027093_58990 [Paraburkholderia jirisanensis]
MANDEAVEWSATPPVTKSALCRLLRWSRPKLDLRLDTDAGFPVLQRGVKGGGWRFDPDAVVAYLEGESCSGEGLAVESELGLRAKATPAPRQRSPIAHAGEETARQRRDVVQIEILTDKLRHDRRELVQVDQMNCMLSLMLKHIDDSLDALTSQLSVKLKVSADGEAAIHDLINDLKKAAALELRSLTDDRRV